MTAPLRARSTAQASAPYLDAVVGYGFRGAARFHIPGHKGGPGADAGLLHALGDRALALDIPQDIRGVDVGDEPTPFAQAELLAAEAYGAAQSWLLTNGATQGNHALCMALAPLGAEVVVQRNAHASIVDGLVLSGGRPAFVAPEHDHETGMAHLLTPAALEQALDGGAGWGPIRAAFVVSPTYYGMCADIPALARVCAARGVPLVVDQSWGPHFGFHPAIPGSALSQGASAVLTSTHKIGGSLTQSAMLHVAPPQEGFVAIDPAVVSRCLRLLRSTSPSSLLMASLDAARRQLVIRGEALLHETLAGINAARERIAAIEGISVIADELVGSWGIAAHDPMRLVLDTRQVGRSGYEVADALRQRYDLHVELATQATVVAVIGMGQPAADLLRFAGDLEEIAGEMRTGQAIEPIVRGPHALEHELVVLPREAFLGAAETVAVDDAVGRVSCESIAGYPPGIPALLPGERITAEVVEYLREILAAGGRLHGASDPNLGSITVLAQDGARPQ
ncbi:MAG: DegT/DnrJ/EryC1/StrS family aminotransferase [Baekduia sp.]